MFIQRRVNTSYSKSVQSVNDFRLVTLESLSMNPFCFKTFLKSPAVMTCGLARLKETTPNLLLHHVVDINHTCIVLCPPNSRPSNTRAELEMMCLFKTTHCISHICHIETLYHNYCSYIYK